MQTYLFAALIVTTLATGCAQDAGFGGGSGKAASAPASTTEAADAGTADVGTADVGTADATPAEAVTAGSFTAWTVPKTPGPYEDYRIFIKVTLPNGKAIDREDLSGNVAGTDDYRQDLARTNDDLQFVNAAGSALLVLDVPGTYKGVQDTIAIRSASLGESQTLVLHFN